MRSREQNRQYEITEHFKRASIANNHKMKLTQTSLRIEYEEKT